MMASKNHCQLYIIITSIMIIIIAIKLLCLLSVNYQLPLYLVMNKFLLLQVSDR